jgi:hypothetical protein
MEKEKMHTLDASEISSVSGGGVLVDTVKVVLAVGEQLWDLSKGLVTGLEDGWNAAGKESK